MLNTASLRASLHAYLQVFSNRTDVSTDSINTHGELLRKVDGVLEGVAAKEDGIVASKVLSREGQSQALAELGTATAPKLAFLERVVRHLDDDRRTTKATLYTVKKPAALGADPVLQYLYGKEIRDRYTGLTQQARDMAFLKAAEATDIVDTDDEEQAAVDQARRDETLWAMLTMPGEALITKDIQDRALTERARRRNPQIVERLKQVELLHESLSGLRDSLVDWLKGLGADPKKVFDELGGAEPPELMQQRAARMVAA